MHAKYKKYHKRVLIVCILHDFGLTIIAVLAHSIYACKHLWQWHKLSFPSFCHAFVRNQLRSGNVDLKIKTSLYSY
jgi:hypothetical protein